MKYFLKVLMLYIIVTLYHPGPLGNWIEERFDGAEHVECSDTTTKIIFDWGGRHFSFCGTYKVEETQ